MILLLNFVSKQITIYFGSSILILGIIGGLLNLLVFLSLKTFRESSCAFYLTIMAIVDIGQLLTGLLTRITITGFDNDITLSSLFYCKFRAYFYQFFSGTSISCMCAAAINQYLCTCSNPRWQQWSKIKINYGAAIGIIIFCFLHGIPYLIFYNLSISTTGQVSCIITNPIYAQYRTYVILVGLVGFLPIIITIIFGSMAFYNVQQLTYYTVPLVRRELDKQLTSMILIQVLINLFLLSPVVIISVLLLNLDLFRDLNVKAQIQFSFNIAIILYYIHLCVSNRICFFFFFYFIKRLF